MENKANFTINSPFTFDEITLQLQWSQLLPVIYIYM